MNKLVDHDYIDQEACKLKNPTKLLLSQDLYDEFNNSFIPKERRVDGVKYLSEDFKVASFVTNNGELKIEIIPGTGIMEIA